jgi:hypothetical protein
MRSGASAVTIQTQARNTFPKYQEQAVKAFRIKAQDKASHESSVSGRRTSYRTGDAAAEYFRQQASGEIPRAAQNLSAPPVVRSMVPGDGHVHQAANDPGTLLTCLISGRLSFDTGLGQELLLERGDLLLTDANTASPLSAIARDDCEDAGIVEFRHCGINPRDERVARIERRALS